MKRDVTVINKIDFAARNLTSNAGMYLLLENAKAIGIFELIDTDLVLDNESTKKIKMDHIKTMLCGHFIGIDKLERLKLLQDDPLIHEFAVAIKEPETVSRFLGNFSYKTTQMFREINFKVFKKLLYKSKLTSITIDIDSSVINVEGHPEGAAKGYNPKKPGNLCYNIQFAFCDELKAYMTGFVRSGSTYTANGAAEMIKEIVAHIKTDGLEIMFRMDSGYFDEEIIETIESLGCSYLIKAKEYPTLVSQVTDPSNLFVTGEEGTPKERGTLDC
jgi:Transposase DDE domain group 1